MERWESRDALVMRHSPWAFRGAFGVFLLAILSLGLPIFNWLAAGEQHVPALPIVVSLLGIVGGGVASLFFASGAVKRAESSVACDTSGVYVDGERVLDRAHVAYGFVEPQPRGEPHVKLFDATHGLRLAVRVRDAADGQALLQALGIDVGQRVAPFFAASPIAGARNTVGAGVLFFVVLLAILFGVQWFPNRSPEDDALKIELVFAYPAIFFALWSVLSSMATRVSVGADGVHTSWLGRRRFVPYSEIDRVVPEFGQLRIVLKGGKRGLALRGQRRSFRASTRADHRAMVERMRAAIVDHLAHEKARETAESVPRARASVADWLRELRALAVGAEGSYRQTVLTHDSLWRVVEDPSIDADVRAGAAVALGGAMDADARARLRVAAQASASPQLRVALEAAASPEDDVALEEALVALTHGEPKRARRA
jgi:hypothetical protein